MSHQTNRIVTAALGATVASLLVVGCGASDTASTEGSTTTASETSQAPEQETEQAPEQETEQEAEQDSPDQGSDADRGDDGAGEMGHSHMKHRNRHHDATVVLNAPNVNRGEHRPTMYEGRGDAVISVRHHPSESPVRALIVNKDEPQLTAKIRTGTGSDAKTLGTYDGRHHGPVRMAPRANTIDIEADGYWLVKLLPNH